MQANAAPTQATSTERVAAQFAALAHYVMSHGNGELLPAVDELGVSLSQMKALSAIEAAGELPLKAVGEALGLSLPAVSRSVEGLVKRGLVTREECPEDRRSKLVRATPEGSAKIREIGELRMSGLRSFVETLSQEEIDVLAPALELLARRPEIAALVSLEDPA
jgi:DNA-binding MarR family transcriptional regulator